MKRWASALVAGGLMALSGCRKGPDAAALSRTSHLRHLLDGRPARRIEALQALESPRTRAEVASILRAAEGMPAEVRIAVAESLGRTRLAAVRADDDAFRLDPADALGTLLADPSDTVRAAVVRGLASLGTPRTHGYVSKAYVEGGPATRAVLSDLPPEWLQRAVESETLRMRRRVDAPPPVDPDQDIALTAVPLLKQRGMLGSPADIEALRQTVASDRPLEVAAAIDALASTGDRSSWDSIAPRLGSDVDAVAAAAVRALAAIGPSEPSARLELATRLLESAATAQRTAEIEALLSLLSTLPTASHRTPAFSTALCRTATTQTDLGIALSAAALVETPCPTPAPSNVVWTVWAAQKWCDPTLRTAARSALADPSAPRAAAAALFLATCGEASDGLILLARAEAEWAAFDAQRTGRATDRARAEDRRQEADDTQRQVIEMMMGETEAQTLLKALPRPLATRLGQRLAGATARGEERAEPRPGAAALLSTATTGAARLSPATLPPPVAARIEALLLSLVRSPDPRLREAGVDAVALAPPSVAAAARGWIGTHGTGSDQTRLSIHQWESSDPSTPPTTLDVSALESRDKVRVAAQWAVRPSELTPAVLDALAEEPAASETMATVVARRIPAAQAWPLIDRWWTDPAHATAVESIVSAWGMSTDGGTPGAAAQDRDAVTLHLRRSALHPEPAVRAASLRTLGNRRECAAIPALAPLEKDPAIVVRTAWDALRRICAESP